MLYSTLVVLANHDDLESHIQIRCIEGVFVDEFFAGFDVIAHEGGEDCIGDDLVIHPDLEKGSLFRVHGGLP